MLISTPKDRPLTLPFSHKWQIWLFLIFICFFLLFPVMPKPEWTDRSTLYLAFDGTRGSYGYLANHILQEETNIDILFLGHSGLEAGINPIIIKKALQPILGREPVIYVVGHIWDALDYDYIALTDILRKRKVRLVIWQRNSESVHTETYSFVNYLWDFYLHRSALVQLDNTQRTSIYFSNVMNGLRLALSPLRDRLSPVRIGRCLNQRVYYGGCMRWQERKGLDAAMPSTPLLPVGRLVHVRGSGDPVLVEKGNYTPYDRVFSDAVFDLAKAQGTQVALIQVPSLINKTPLQKVTIPTMMPDQPGNNAFILGVPMTDLFPGKNVPEIVNNYYIDKESMHFHHAAADYFTRAMLPGIISVFQQTMHGKTVQP